MNFQQFLRHHKITKNPFAEEDAQTDPIFKEHCISKTYHPAWDKVFGNPAEPATSVVFGEKGSGKTALRLQIDDHLRDYNVKNPDKRCFVIQYDDFNPFLDEFAARVGRGRKNPNKVLLEYQLWDHMDAILSKGTTQLVDAILASNKKSAGKDVPALDPKRLRKLDRHQRRDLLLLDACYDNSRNAPAVTRWQRLRRRIRYRNWSTWLPIILFAGVVVALIGAAVYLFSQKPEWWAKVYPYWPIAAVAVGLAAVPWIWRAVSRWQLGRSIAKRIRVIKRRTSVLRRLMSKFPSVDLIGQPIPNKDRTDDRYSLLGKLQGILETLGYTSVVVLVDRIDEPHMINGSSELMRAFLWPMLDNKFLKQPGMGMKLLLPSELTQFVDREDRDFYQRARLDKQNMIPSLNWTGEALYDVANARLAACAEAGADPPPKLTDLLDEGISQKRVFEGLQSLRVPRHVCKFLYRLIVAHCHKHSDDDPQWRIATDTFESELAVYSRDLTAADRGLGSG